MFGSKTINNNKNKNKKKCDCKSILIVDDDGFNLKVLEMNLLKLNKKCELACNGKEAINILVSKYSKETRC